MIIVSTRIVTYLFFLLFCFVFLPAVKLNVKHISRIEPQGRLCVVALIINYLKTNSVGLFLNTVHISVLLAAGTAFGARWFRLVQECAA
jgi:uncharacterized membrane protein